MSPEQSPPPVPEVQLPSDLRIRQRLGMLTIGSPAFREAVIPSIAQLEGQTMTPAELAHDLEARTTAQAETHMLGIDQLAHKGIPTIIDLIVDNPDQKNAALDAWEALKAKRIAEGAITDQRERYHRRKPSTHQIRRAKRRGRY